MIYLEEVTLAGVLYGINLRVPDGGYVGIAGPNGCGKSTLARIIKGLQDQGSGNIYINGVLKPAGISDEVAVVMTFPENQLVSSSIEEDVAFGLENMNLPSGEIASRTEDALKWASLWDIRERPAHHLSAAQQQMLVLAGLTAMRPKYIILDEALSILGGQEKAVVKDAIRSMNREQGMGVLHISHELDELLKVDELYVMNKGRIVWNGSPCLIHEEEALLEKIGLELPPIMKLKSLLLKDGFRINEEVVGEEDLAGEILRLVRTSS